MTVPPPISAFLITLNEEARLPRALASLQGLADQIVVVDSGSTDATLEIARAAGAEVHHRDWTGYGPQKRFAESLCRHEWRLNLDADEALTPDLVAEMREVLARDPAPAAYAVPSLKVYPGDEAPRPFAMDHRPVRLYHASVAAYRDHALFDRVESSVPARRLRAPLYHFTVGSWQALVAKENAYTSYVAKTAKPKPRALLLLRLITEGPMSFIKTWIFRGAIFGGWKGLTYAGIIAFARWLRIVKMLERAEAAQRKAD